MLASIKMPSFRLAQLPLSLLVPLAMGFVSSARGATSTFNATTGVSSWGVAGNWTPTGIPDAVDAGVVFKAVTASSGRAELQNTSYQVGSIAANVSGGGWNLANTSGNTGKINLATSVGVPSITVQATAGTQTLSLNVGLTGNQGVDILGGTSGGTIQFLGDNTGLTGGFNFRSTAAQIAVFSSGSSAGSNDIRVYTSVYALRLGQASASTEFTNNIALQSGVTGVTLQTNSGVGQTTKLSGVISGAGDVNYRAFGGGNFELSGVNTYTGKTSLTGGYSTTFHSVSNFGNGSTISFLSASGASPELIYAAGNTDDLTKKADGSTRIVDLSSATAKINTGTNNVTFANPLTGSFSTSGLIKAGSGTLRLQGASSYKASTLVSEGTLLINNSTGSGTGTSEVTVQSILGGIGTIKPDAAKNIIIASTGILSPGDSQIGNGIGVLTLDLSTTTGNASFASGSKLTFDLGSGLTSDRLAFNSPNAGSIIFGGTTTIDFTDLTAGSLSLGSYTLITASNASAYSGLTLSGSNITGGLVIGAGLSQYTPSLSLQGNNVVLTIQAIPEPATTALVISAALLFGLKRLRQRKLSV